MKRGSFQGVTSVIRFNWHFYVLAVAGVLLLLTLTLGSSAWWARTGQLLAAVTGVSVMLSLVATWSAYDASGLYRLDWLTPWMPSHGTVANIHAGFDETSGLLRARFPDLDWRVFDFFDPRTHTEISIRRARESHPRSTDTVAITTRALPMPDSSLERIMLMLAAHEIRDAAERIEFFRELHRVLTADGLVIVTEHLRDAQNILAYNLGAWHFHPRPVWIAAFAAAGFAVTTTLKPAPLITTFVLRKHGRLD